MFTRYTCWNTTLSNELVTELLFKINMSVRILHHGLRLFWNCHNEILHVLNRPYKCFIMFVVLSHISVYTARSPSIRSPTLHSLEVVLCMTMCVFTANKNLVSFNNHITSVGWEFDEGIFCGGQKDCSWNIVRS